MEKNYKLKEKKANGTDTDLANVIAHAMALQGFTISKKVYDKMPEMFKEYFEEYVGK